MRPWHTRAVDRRGALVVAAVVQLSLGCEKPSTTVSSVESVSVPASVADDAPTKSDPQTDASETPDGPPFVALADGIEVARILLGKDTDHPMRVWLYRPTTPAREPRPLAVIGPAGSDLLSGMQLGDGDRAEHLPWVGDGFVVVSFDIDGAAAPRETPEDRVRSMNAFARANAGVTNARRALEAALKYGGSIDDGRIFAVGHSSAATLALVTSSFEPRIDYVVAFAPVTDLETLFGPLFAAIEKDPDLRPIVESGSPKRRLKAMKAPVFLFHASGDDTVPIADTKAFAKALEAGGIAVELRTVVGGDHYESMIAEGIPAAIEWAKARPAGAR